MFRNEEDSPGRSPSGATNLANLAAGLGLSSPTGNAMGNTGTGGSGNNTLSSSGSIIGGSGSITGGTTGGSAGMTGGSGGLGSLSGAKELRTMAILTCSADQNIKLSHLANPLDKGQFTRWIHQQK